MAFTAKILSCRFRHLNIVGCLLKRRATRGGGGSRAPQDPPSYAPEADVLTCYLFFCFTFCSSKSRVRGNLKLQLSYLPSEEDVQNQASTPGKSVLYILEKNVAASIVCVCFYF